MNKEQIYHVISKRFPQSEIYVLKTSKGIKETKAEITVINWKKYEKAILETKIMEFHKIIIEEITTRIEDFENFQKLEILNFKITHLHNGEMKEVIPIENKKIMRFLNLTEKNKIFI